VWPSPRPEIIGTATPQAATSGAKHKLILSPTPPVECLSTRARFTLGRVRTLPECSMASVKASVSLRDRPFKNAAISQALAW
jgi:hypothetical protein